MRIICIEVRKSLWHPCLCMSTPCTWPACTSGSLVIMSMVSSFSRSTIANPRRVQVLQGEPRVPYLHGITVPSRSKDAYMRAVSHLCLFKPHRCCRSDVCGHAAAVDYFRCATVPLEWKVTEAELQTCADRADVPRLVYRYKACGMCAGYLKGCRVEGLHLSSAAGKVDDRAPMRDGILSVCCCRSLPPHVCESWFGICKAVVSDLTD